MIADFGLSRVMETEKLSLLTEICGTPGVSVPSASRRQDVEGVGYCWVITDICVVLRYICSTWPLKFSKRVSGTLHQFTLSCKLLCAAGHGKPVDVWAMGVITYFLLAGYTPFDRDTQQLEMEAILAGDYKFEPGSSPT
jgi:serine/threonine protein kinase